ncbi:uncharacterized protein LOC135503498 isoform X2 [Lineus longissimus]|uniref:uncharacterized protein LOC135503498 isoform X2 n=1 Tax=Lineus longissimus TaxID=88925 RepID=UPI00315D2EE8
MWTQNNIGLTMFSSKKKSKKVSKKAVEGKNVVDERQSGKFRHSHFISNAFDFLDEFEEEIDDQNISCNNNACSKQCGLKVDDFDSEFVRGSETDDQNISADGRDFSADVNQVVNNQGTNGEISNTGTLHSVTNTESNSSARAANGNESRGTVPNGNEPSEDRMVGHIDYSNPSRRTNEVNVGCYAEDCANQKSYPGENFAENGQNTTFQSRKTSSGLIRDSSMPGCYGNTSVGDELGIGALTGGETDGVALHSCGLKADGVLEAPGTMCAENMDEFDSKEDGPCLKGRCPELKGDATELKVKATDSNGLSRSVSSQDKNMLTNGKNCDISDLVEKKIPGSVSVPSNLECSGSPTMTGDVITKSDEVIDMCVKNTNVVDSADQNCDEKLKTKICDSEKDGLTDVVVKNQANVYVEAQNGSVEKVESNGHNGVVKNVELNGTNQSTAVGTTSEDSGLMKRSVDSDLDTEVKVVLRRSAANSPSRFSESSSRGTSEDEDDDEDAGVYGETHRYSQWILSDEDDKLQMAPVIENGPGVGSEGLDDAFFEQDQDVTNESKTHRRLESQSSTTSEREFKRKYQHVSRKVVKRKSSLQAYERLSERICEPERKVLLERASKEQDFGFHIKGSEPVFISTIESGTIAEEAGVQVGEIIVSVNGVNCMEATRDEVIELMLKEPSKVVLELSKSNRNPDDASEEPIMTGYLMKQSGTALLKTWRRRYFVLKRDHCLYYYKTEAEKDPIGAIVLLNYSIIKVSDSGIMGRKHAFKAVKYGAKSYYFAAESEHEMLNWANALNELAKSAGRTDTWLDISSPNVDVPALSIKNPDCHGNLCKLGVKRRHWRRRYCVLKDACIYYYMDVNASTAQGVAHLHGYTVLDSSPHSRKFTFTLQPPEGRMRTFFFSTENETDLLRWTSSLRKSIARWVKTVE